MPWDIGAADRPPRSVALAASGAASSGSGTVGAKAIGASASAGEPTATSASAQVADGAAGSPSLDGITSAWLPSEPEALNLGAYDVLAKPFHPKEVMHTVGSAWRNWNGQNGTTAKVSAARS